MSAEEGNNRSDRAQKLFEQVAADIATQSQSPNDERTASTEVGTAKNIDSGTSANVVDAPETEEKMVSNTHVETPDETGPAGPGLASAPTEGTKESEDRLRVVVPYSQGTFDHRHELRQLGMVPNLTRKVWEGTLSSTSRLKLLELGLQFRVLLPEPAPTQEVPKPEAHPIEVSGPTFPSRVQLKQLGLRWIPGKEVWQGVLAGKELESTLQLATERNLRVVSEGNVLVETLADRARREERLARKMEPTFHPDRTEVLGLSDERLETEAVEQARLAVRSYQALDGAARQEVNNRLVELGTPTDPEDAQRAFDSLRGVDLEDGRAKAVYRVGRLLGTLSVADYLRLRRGDDMDGLAAIRREEASRRADDLFAESTDPDTNLASTMWWFNRELGRDLTDPPFLDGDRGFRSLAG